MRILMVSTSYPSGSGDWRGLFIRHLTWALARRPDIALRTWSPPGELPDNVVDAATSAESAWLAELMAAGGIAHLVRAGGLRGVWQPLRLLGHLRRLYRREAGLDLRHVNWLQNALVLPRDRVPLLTTVLGTDMQLLRLPGMTALLRRVFRRRATAICPNADWMVPELERRFGDVAQVRFVPFGIDPCWFELVRAPSTPARWLCVSRITRGKIGTLFDWCAPHFQDGRRELHLFGPMQEEMTLPPWVVHHGPATPDQLCKDAFPAATGLVTLSQHAEGRPQVMLEAMAAGLPIIASDIPAHRDLLRHGETGWLCDGAEGLAPAFATLEQAPRNRAIGTAARDWVRAQIGTWDDCAARYAALYRQLLSGARE